MAILNYNEANQEFIFNQESDLPHIAKRAESELFSPRGFHVIKNFIDKSVADRIREYYTGQNSSSFFADKSKLFAFHGQSQIIYYPRSPFKNPRFIMSAYKNISLLRNRIYRNQDFYKQYCVGFKLNPDNFESVYETQTHHTWARISWYKDHDGQCPHLDNYGEIAAFLILSKKGVHWEKGGLFLYDKNGERTVEVDTLCDIGDLLFLDQQPHIHGVEPIIGSKPGRLLFYVPIIPFNYIKPWFTFGGHPYKVFHSNPSPSLKDRAVAGISNAWSYWKGTSPLHYSRKEFKHKTWELPPACLEKNQSFETNDVLLKQ